MRSVKAPALERQCVMRTSCKTARSLRTQALSRCQHQECPNAQQQAACRRRAVATSGLLTALWMQLGSSTAQASAIELPQLLPAPSLLKQLLSPDVQDISNPGVSWAVGKRSKQLFYPSWMEGTWQFAASFGGVTFPQGQSFISKSTPGVTKASMVMSLADVGAGMEAPVVYLQRFTQSSEEGGIVADRPFNIQQQVDAFLRYPAVQHVEYSPLENPTRLAIVYKTPRKDASEISSDLRKAEIFINNRGSAETADGTWIGWENIRQVNQARQQGSIGDYLIAWSVSQTDADTLLIRHRSAAFLQPQDPQYFGAGSSAVAVYDYQISAKRME